MGFGLKQIYPQAKHQIEGPGPPFLWKKAERPMAMGYKIVKAGGAGQEKDQPNSQATCPEVFYACWESAGWNGPDPWGISYPKCFQKPIRPSKNVL